MEGKPKMNGRMLTVVLTPRAEVLKAKADKKKAEENALKNKVRGFCGALITLLLLALKFFILFVCSLTFFFRSKIFPRPQLKKEKKEAALTAATASPESSDSIPPVDNIKVVLTSDQLTKMAEEEGGDTTEGKDLVIDDQELMNTLNEEEGGGDGDGIMDELF